MAEEKAPEPPVEEQEQEEPEVKVQISFMSVPFSALPGSPRVDVLGRAAHRARPASGAQRPHSMLFYLCYHLPKLRGSCLRAHGCLVG